MNVIDRIKTAGGNASDAEYEEQRYIAEYNAFLDLKKQDIIIMEGVAGNESGINYLMAETSSLRAMIEELATMLDNDGV